MEINKPRIAELKCHIDDRGFLTQIWDTDLATEIKRIYAVENFNKDIVRGFHHHRKEWKYFYVLRGSAKFVTVSSINQEDIQKFVLSDKMPAILIVPPNHYNGWKALEDNTILIGMSNFTLKESLQDDQRISPVAFGKDIWEVESR